MSQPQNRAIIKRWSAVSALVDELLDLDLDIDRENNIVKIGGKELLRADVDNERPSVNIYNAAASDGLTDDQAYRGVEKMARAFLTYNDIALKTGSLLGGFDFDDPHHPMIEQYRLISNTITNDWDRGSLNSFGQSRHPSSHFADNNYFFEVAQALRDMRQGCFDPWTSHIVLRWPTPAYYGDKDWETEVAPAMRETLIGRFPYKFFYMWSRRTEGVHLISLQAYRNLIFQADGLGFDVDKQQNLPIDQFMALWPAYSQMLCDLIPKNERGDNFLEEFSLFLSVIMLEEPDLANATEMLSTGSKAMVLYGPPGTGKTFKAKKITAEIIDCPWGDLANYRFDGVNGLWTLVQFHPGYTYEDFIGGISPKLSGNSLAYTLKTGVFKALCDCAVKNPGRNYVIIVDEINRADLSAVFGELMYALEYRGEAVAIPNFKEPFVIPENVYLIGTMNTADKSLVSFDIALRRRFGFYKMLPDMGALRQILAHEDIDDDVLEAFISRCQKLNEDLKTGPLGLGEDFQIGHAYFGKIKNYIVKSVNSTESTAISTYDLERLWVYHLEPLLEEFAYGAGSEPSQIIEELKRKFIAEL